MDIPTFFEAQALLPKSCSLDLAAWDETMMGGNTTPFEQEHIWLVEEI